MPATEQFVMRRGLHDEDEGWEERLFETPDEDEEEDDFEGEDDEDLDEDDLDDDEDELDVDEDEEF